MMKQTGMICALAALLAIFAERIYAQYVPPTYPTTRYPPQFDSRAKGPTQAAARYASRPPGPAPDRYANHAGTNPAGYGQPGPATELAAPRVIGSYPDPARFAQRPQNPPSWSTLSAQSGAGAAILPAPGGPATEVVPPGVSVPFSGPQQPYRFEVPPPVIATFDPLPRRFEGSVEIGVNGTDGSTETFNYRVGTDGKYKADIATLSYDLFYKRETTGGTTIANRFFFEGLTEFPIHQSPFSFFVNETVEWDEFQVWGTRVAANAGIGYSFWDHEMGKAAVSVGAGVSRETQGPDDNAKAEMSFGTQIEQKLNQRHKLSASARYFPQFEDFADARIISKADWEMLLHELWNLSLKLSVTDRYDSSPGGGPFNDLDYSVVLLWKI